MLSILQCFGLRGLGKRRLTPSIAPKPPGRSFSRHWVATKHQQFICPCKAALSNPDCLVGRLRVFAFRSLRHRAAAVFLRLILFNLLLRFTRHTRAAAAGQKQSHQDPCNFHCCSPSWELFLLRKKSGGRTKSSGRKKTPTLLLILNTR